MSRGDRQPKRQNCGKRRSARLRRRQEDEGQEAPTITDTQGFLVGAIVHTADEQDPDGAPDVLASIRHRFPLLGHVFANGGYAGNKLRTSLTKLGKWTIKTIKRSDRAKGFEFLPRRWVVERTLAWLGRNRCVAKHCERTIESATAWLHLASIQLTVRRIASA